MKTYPVVQFEMRGAVTEAAGEGRPYTIVYDGACNVCQRLVRLLRRWDTRGIFEIVPSRQAGVRARFPWIPDRAFDESVQLIGPGGETWQGASAIEKTLDLLPKGCLFSWLFSIPFARTAAERFYRWFARHRYNLGCGEHCSYRALDVDFHDHE